jgi:DNA polymerase III subunit beta
MKISIEQPILRKAISIVIGSVAPKSNIPVLQNIKIDVNNGKIHLSATDQDTSIKNSCEALVELEGSTTVPANTFFDIIKKIPSSSKISIEQESPSILLIKSGRSRYKLPCISSDEFPAFTEAKVDNEFIVDAKEFINLIDKTKFAISNDLTRYYLNGLCLNSVKLENGFELSSVATDGHRLSFSTIDCDLNSEFSIIIPKKSVNDIRKLSEESNSIQIGCSKNVIKIVANEITYVSKLIDGEFPDCRKVIPQNNDQLAIIDKQNLFECVDRISTVTTDKHNSIKLIFENNKLILEASSGREELDINYQGDKIEIGFNSKYILDVISHISGNSVELNLKNNQSPALIKSLNSQFVLMPTRV